MKLHEINLNASVVANSLGRFYCGPLLLASEVRLKLPDEGKSPSAHTRITIGQDHPLVQMNGGMIPEFLLTQFARQLGMLLLESREHSPSLQSAPGMPLVRFTEGGTEEPGTFDFEVVPVVRESLSWRFLALARRQGKGIGSIWQFVLNTHEFS